MVTSVLTTNWRQSQTGPFRRFFGQVVTFHLVTLAFVFFRAASLHASVHILQTIARAATVSAGTAPLDGDIFRSALAASFIAMVLGYGLYSRNVEDFLAQVKGWHLYLIYGIALLAIVLLKVVDGGQFIYARF
jgi:hypothetical protein